MALLLAGYAAFLHHHAVRSVGGSDVYSYASAGRALAEGKILRRIPALEELGLPAALDRLFIPLGAVPGREPGTMVSVVPVGTPLHMAAAGLFLTDGPFLVSPLAAVATLVLVFSIGRELGLPRAWALAGSAIVAAFPGFLHAAVMPMSDVLATCWACAAVFAALRARRHSGFAALAGAAFAIGFLVRPTNALLGLALLFALPAGWRSWRLFLAGAVLPALAWVGYNLSAFGRPLASGYGPLKQEISPDFLAARLRHYLGWISRLSTPLPLLGWTGFLFDRRSPRRDRFLLFSWFGAFLLFYSVLSFEETGWHTRYVLPGFPALVLGAILLARRLAGGSRSLRAAAAVACLAVLAIEVRFVSAHRVHKSYKLETLYPEAARFAAARVPGRSLVVSMQMSGSLEYYTALRPVLWTWIPPDGPPEPLVRTARERGFGWYGLLAPFELEQAQTRLPGSWRELGTVGDVTLWKIEPAERWGLP